MGFSNMLEILQEKNKGKIVLIKLGTFYIATGRDALLLSVKLGLKCTCYEYMQAVLKLFENDALKGKSDELDGK